jgi:hypothetical protein
VVLLTIGVALPFLVGHSTADAARRSRCEDDRAVGRICHYVAIVSEGPDYDVSMSMIRNSTGLKVSGVNDWRESNPDYTRWYWDYDQNVGDDPDFHLQLRVVVRGALTGLETDLPGGRDSCFQIRAATKAVDQVDCPQSSSPGPPIDDD